MKAAQFKQDSPRNRMPTYSRFMDCIHVEERLGVLEIKKRQSTAVKTIVSRCVESSTDVDIRDFGLMELPDDIFILVQPRKILRFVAAQNFLTKIPFNISTFVNLTTLDVSFNRLSTLPRELNQCKKLTSVNISTNNFVEIPNILLEIQTIININAKGNFIAEVDEEKIENLDEINLENNPLSNSCHGRLLTISKVHVILSDKRLEDWEDLTI